MTAVYREVSADTIAATLSPYDTMAPSTKSRTHTFGSSAPNLWKFGGILRNFPSWIPRCDSEKFRAEIRSELDWLPEFRARTPGTP
eukprot:420425-Rhodomonas_salina.1